MTLDTIIILAVGGAVVILVGFIALIIKLYEVNKVQGAVSDMDPSFPALALTYGLFNLKYTKWPLIIILVGVVMIVSIFIG